MAIRGDDTCFFTSPETLERVYGRYWDRIPISLAVVLNHASTRSKGIPPEYWDGDRVIPLDDNLELVSFLREGVQAGRLSILLHGYSHANVPGGYEFEAAPDLDRRLVRGQGYLEALLGVENGPVDGCLCRKTSRRRSGARAWRSRSRPAGRATDLRIGC